MNSNQTKPILKSRSKEKSRFRIIRIDDYFIVMDCQDDDIWHPFSKAWQADNFITAAKLWKKNKIKPTADISDFEFNPGFRAISEAKAEFEGKLKTSKDPSLWQHMLLRKREINN